MQSQSPSITHSLDDYNRSFQSFLFQVKQSKLDYCPAYLALISRIRPQKCLTKAIPSPEEIAQSFQIFLHRKSRGVKNSPLLKYWSHKHLDTFLFLLACFQSITGHEPQNFTDNDWGSISQLLPYTRPQSLKYKWACLQANQNKVSHNWTVGEEMILKQLIGEFSPELLRSDEDFNENAASPKVKWSIIAMELNQRAHNNQDSESYFPKLGKHCRERWFNHLTPNLKKTEWTDSDDLKLMELAVKFDRKWAKIAQKFSGRTQHNVKNRYLSLIAREYKISRKKLSAKLVNCKTLLQNTLTSLRKRVNETSAKSLLFHDTYERFESSNQMNNEEATLEEVLLCDRSEVFSHHGFDFEPDRMEILLGKNFGMMEPKEENPEDFLGGFDKGN